MWSKTLAVLAFGQTIAAQSIPTWPSSVDEIEDLMVLQTGYNARGFAGAVTPCDNSPIKGFRVAAGFVRTAFHDVAAYDASARSGGLDGSIGYELGPPYDVHNAGPAFDATIINAHPHFNSKASISDMIALGVYAAVRSCGGPVIPMRAGRIDATGPGPNQLPDVEDSIGTLTGRFAKMGFTPQEMISLVACGHTLGGVHPQLSQNVAGQNDATKAQAQGVLTFDTTDAAFDNRVATEYMDGSTQSPLVVGRTKSGRDLNSDLRVFSSDGNNTIRAMTNPGIYAAQCQNVMTKMIEKVPGNVQLSDIIVPYTVKPGNLNLEVLDKGAALGFSGEIRVRTNDLNRGSISGISIVYKDRSGASCADCKISAQFVGDASGFDDQFSFYRFAGKIKSISSFNVVITTNGGQQRLFDNNGKGFPYSDAAFVQVSSSAYSGSTLRVVVAARADQGTPAMTVTSHGGHVFNQLPQLTKSSLSVSKICGDSNWVYYVGIGSAPSDAKIDVTIGGQTVDGFRDIEFGTSGQTPVCGGTTSTTTSTSTTSKSSSTISSSITTTSKSSSSISSSSTSTGSKTSSGSSSSSTLTSTLTSTKTSSTSSGSSTLTTSTKSGSSTSSGSTSSGSTSSGSTSSGSSSSTSVSGTLTSTSSGSSSSLTSTSSSSSATFDGTLTSSSTSSETTGTESSSTTDTDSSTTVSGTATSTTGSDSSSTLTSLTTSTGTGYQPPFWEPITSGSPTSGYTQQPDVTTTVVTAITTYCPYPTTIITNGHTYIVAVPTMLTITDCPCTVTLTGKGSGPSAAVSTGDVPSGTYVPPNNKPNKSKGAEAVNAAYQNIRPAPSGGSDGGDKNIEGVNVHISISEVQLTVTKTIAIIATNVASDEWKPWTDTAYNDVVKPTGASGNTAQWGTASVGASASASYSASAGTWGTAWVPQGPSATKSGPIAKFTGAANIVAARGEIVMMGAAAVVGAVALVL